MATLYAHTQIKSNSPGDNYFGKTKQLPLSTNQIIQIIFLRGTGHEESGVKTGSETSSQTTLICQRDP